MHERVVVARDGKRPRPMAEHLHLTADVGLHPDRRVGLADVAQ